MNKQTAGTLLLAILLAPIAPAAASTLDVTTNSQVTLGTDDSLIFYISSGSSSFTKTTYPGEVEVLLGSMPLSGSLASIPGTSAVYVPGMLFTGTIESQNGSISIPLVDSNATRLGLPAGDLLLTTGSRSGGSYSGSIDLLSADVILSSQQAAAVFASGEAEIDIQNTGSPVTFGYSGSPIVSDLTASLVGDGGTQSVGAQVLNAECVHHNTPEPGTIGLLIIGLTILTTRLARRQPVLAHSRAGESRRDS
jgi:hypothetical protein